MKVFEPMIGRDIQYVARQMVALANQHKEPVGSTFNTVEIVANPGDDPSTVADQYFNAFPPRVSESRSVGKVTEEEIQIAIQKLSQSERGRQAMTDVFALLDHGATSLDQSGQLAVFSLVCAGFEGMAGTALQQMRDALAINDG